MNTDFPAAHSMDTTWFAVDRDGHVGYFDSGEAGAVPLAGEVEDPGPLLQAMARVVSASVMPEQDLQGRLLPGTSEAQHYLVHAKGHCEDALVFLKSLDLVQDALAAGQATKCRPMRASRSSFTSRRRT